MKKYLLAGLFTTVLLAAAPLHAQKPGSMAQKELLKSLQLRNAQLEKQIAQLQRAHERLLIQNAKESTYQTRLFNRAKQAVFRAMPKHKGSVNTYTGTVFEVRRNGRKEVFGTVAMHALQDVFATPGMLGKEFSALVVSGTQVKTIPARIVQLSSSAMGDLALVKFQPEDERLFRPLSLEEVSLSFPAQGYAQGYACNLLSKQTFSIVGNTSIGMLQAHLPAVDQGQRAGFCGSPVFTTNFRFAGVHVGSSYETNAGYIAPISVLQKLVESYHNPGKHVQSIVLADKEIGTLTITEYVARIEFLDANKQVIWEKETHSKFSLRNAEQELLQHPNTAFIRLYVGNSHWHTDEHGSYVLDDEYHPRVIETAWPAK